MLLYADKLRTQFVSSWHSSLVVLQLSLHAHLIEQQKRRVVVEGCHADDVADEANIPF